MELPKSHQEKQHLQTSSTAIEEHNGLGTGTDSKPQLYLPCALVGSLTLPRTAGTCNTSLCDSGIPVPQLQEKDTDGKTFDVEAESQLNCDIDSRDI